jgi:hypothetical protein
MAALLVYQTKMVKAHLANNLRPVEQPVLKHPIVRELETAVLPVYLMLMGLDHPAKPLRPVDLPAPETTNVLELETHLARHVLTADQIQLANKFVSQSSLVTHLVREILTVMLEMPKPKVVPNVFLDQMANSPVRKILPVIQHVPETLTVTPETQKLKAAPLVLPTNVKRLMKTCVNVME